MVVLQAKTRYTRCLDGGKNLKKREEKCDHYEEVNREKRKGEKRGSDLVPRHFVVVESIFLFPVFKMRKLIFEKIFRGCRKFLEVVLKMKNAQKPQNRNQTCQRLKIRFTRFTRQNLAHAQTLFSSVKANHKIKTCSQARQTAVRGLVRDCRLLITSFSGNSRGN